MGNLFASGEAALQPLRVSRFFPPGTQEWKINLVISCMDTQLPLEVEHVRHVRFRSKDMPWYPILAHVKEVFDQLNQMAIEPHDKKDACLIHCRDGTNRSMVLALAVKIQQQIQRKRREHVSEKMQRPFNFRVEDSENVLYQALKTTSMAAGKPVLTNVGFQRQLYMWTRFLCLHEKYVRSTSWPRSWGPELWLPVTPISAEMQLALRQFREEKENMTNQQGGSTPQSAFILSVWETANYMQQVHSIRMLRAKPLEHVHINSSAYVA